MQGFKRLKKQQPDGRCGYFVPSDCFKTDESNSRLTTANYKGAPESVGVDRISRVSSIPISIKFKKLANEDASRHREHPRKDSRREVPPIEIGTKRLKVKGPSFLGSESRLE